jgi:hypothetical protein
MLHRRDDAADARLGRAFVLGTRPQDGMTLRATRHPAPGGATATLLVSTPVDRLLADVLTGAATDRYVHVVILGADDAEPRPLPRLVRSGAARASPADEPSIVLGPGRITTRSEALRAAAGRPPAHVLLASGAANVVSAHPGLFAVADADTVEDRRPGPVMVDPASPLWTDRFDPQRLWYAPRFSLVEPDPSAATVEESPFLFRFRRTGVDAQGRPGIEATVRLTLERGMSEATSAELESRGRPAAQPVSTGDLSVELLLPFRDQNGAAATQSVRASNVLQQGERLQATFQLLDGWARVCYAALATAEPGSDAARVSVAYTFGGWDPERAPLPVGAQMLHLAAVSVDRRQTRDGGGGGVRVRFPGGAIELAEPPEPRASSRAGMRPPSAAAIPVAAMSAIRPELIIRPEVAVRPEVAELVAQRRFAWRTYGRSAAVEVRMPCGPMGTLYIEDAPAGARAIGCQDASLLGQVPGRTYEPVALGAATAGIRVLRSLISPGRFVLVPGAYRIGRYEPSDVERAYRPTVLLYSTIDIEHPAQTQCVLAAALQPDVTPAQRFAIREELRSKHHPSPVVEDVTELSGNVRFTWALPGSSGGWSVSAEAIRTWDGFQVTLTTNAAGILALEGILARSGIHGTATIDLGSGASYDVGLDLELARIVGPPRSGPVESSPTRGGVSLRNRVEAPVAVKDVLALAHGSVEVVPVETVLAPDARHEVGLPSSTTESHPDVVVQPTAATLTEIRAYVEDVTAQVLFLALPDLASMGIQMLEVTARLAGTSSERSAVLTKETPSASLEFVLPLTTFAGDPVLEFRVRRTAAEGASDAAAGLTDWRQWRLSTQGHVVSLTRELIS